MIVQDVTLYFQAGTSDKVYQVQLEEFAGGGFVVNFAYGRRGSTLKTGTKTPTPVSQGRAFDIYNKLVASKKRKGYEVGSAGGAFQAGPPAPVSPQTTGIHCQLLNAVDRDTAMELIASPDWWGQCKHDGRRLLVQKTGRQLTAINRRGLAVGAPAIVMNSLGQAVGDFIIDGELVGEIYFVFDRLDQPRLPYAERLERLGDLRIPTEGAIVITETARSFSEKQMLYNSVQNSWGEGVVFKQAAAPYTPGRPNSGGPQVKYKFYTSATVQVAGHNEKRSVAINLLDAQNEPTPVGNVTIPPNYQMPQVGAAIEVRYLYAYRGGSLYQPVYLGERDDVDIDDLAGLKFKPEN